MASDPLPSQEVINQFVGVAHGNFARVKELLEQYPALIDAPSSVGETPIQAAAQMGQKEIANLLLAAGAPLEICTAAMLGDAARVEAFLRADPAQAQATGAHGLPVIYFPALNGRVDIAEMLFAYGAGVNGGEGVTPPVHASVRFNQPSMLEWLLTHGADPNTVDFQGRTALQIAVDAGREELAAVLRTHGGIARVSGFVPVSGGKLYFESEGEGHPFMLAHAGIADRRMWDEQAPAFARRYRVVRYDRRGFGQSQSEAVRFSQSEDLRAVLDHLKLDRVHVMGLSMGGAIAIDFTLTYPERVSALIAAAAGLSGHWPKPDGSEQSQFEERVFAEMDKASADKELARLQAMELDMWVEGPLQSRGRAPAAVREKVGRMNADAYAHAGEGSQAEPLTPPAVGRLHEIKAPTLVLIGDLDVSSEIATSDLLANGIAGARKVVIHGAAHMLNMERPEEFNRIVLEFLDTVMPAA